MHTSHTVEGGNTPTPLFKGNISMFADGIAFMCFYDADHGLSAIAKFHVHLVAKGEELGEIDPSRGTGTVIVGKGRYRGLGNGNTQKIAPKCNTFGIWGCLLWLPTCVIHCYKALFTSTICLAYSMPLSWTFRSYLPLRLTILEKYSKIQHIWPFGISHWAIPPYTICL